MSPEKHKIPLCMVRCLPTRQRQRWLDLTTVIGYAAYVAAGTQLFVLLAPTKGNSFGQTGGC
jgi:hypothetical protein